MVILRATILLTLLTTALSCSCFPSRFETQYCQSPVVARGIVVAKFDNCPGTCDPIADQVRGAITYIVRVLKTFKADEPEDGIMYLRTAVNSALCGTSLSRGTTYLFTLRDPTSRDGQCPSLTHSVSLCDFPRRWKSLTKAQKMFVQRNSRNGDRDCPDVPRRPVEPPTGPPTSFPPPLIR